MDKVIVQGIVVVQVILVVMLTNGYIFAIVKNQIPQKQLQSWTPDRLAEHIAMDAVVELVDRQGRRLIPLSLE